MGVAARCRYFRFVKPRGCVTSLSDMMTETLASFLTGQESLSALIQVFVALGFAGIVVVLSSLFGKRAQHRDPADVPYESGIVPTGKGNPMFSVKFYVVAMLFVIFDLEVVFLYPWAVIFRDYVMNHSEAFISVCIFLAILFVAYLYAFGKGVFQWHKNPEPRC